MNKIGGVTRIKTIRMWTCKEIIMLFADTAVKVNSMVISIEKRVKSLPFVTDICSMNERIRCRQIWITVHHQKSEQRKNL